MWQLPINRRSSQWNAVYSSSDPCDYTNKHCYWSIQHSWYFTACLFYVACAILGSRREVIGSSHKKTSSLPQTKFTTQKHELLFWFVGPGLHLKRHFVPRGQMWRSYSRSIRPICWMCRSKISNNEFLCVYQSELSMYLLYQSFM
jgi:hypothetical protein